PAGPGAVRVPRQLGAGRQVPLAGHPRAASTAAHTAPWMRSWRATLSTRPGLVHGGGLREEVEDAAAAVVDDQQRAASFHRPPADLDQPGDVVQEGEVA